MRTVACMLLTVSLATVQAHRSRSEDSQSPLKPDGEFQTWAKKYGTQFDMSFSGPLSFAHLPYSKCLETENEHQLFDIAVLGMPFDSAVSYRPGARFGPHGIRSGSRRISPTRGYTTAWGYNPYKQDVVVRDCGDVPVVPFDIKYAMDQMQTAYSTLIKREVATQSSLFSTSRKLAKDGKFHPRIIALGGDHAVILPILRSLHEVYGEIAVIHFDSHLDTWPVLGYYGNKDSSVVTHGTMFWTAMTEGLIAKGNSIHAGIRCKMTGIEDIEHDQGVGFSMITTDDIDELGADGIADKIKKHVGDKPVYLSLDIDVIDPAFAPATGTPEPGGWATREVKRILRGLAGLNVVGADVVEVAPAYDTNAETTSLVAADIIHEMLSIMIGKRPAIARVDEKLSTRVEL
ncbi:agmatinase [Rhizoctonia solani AG-3 Rhs1AP]|uniref:Agmatinase n=1 Tax=Rhizoctonia solani AG-3 Rhs1AP TaxID=1086054 RepID=X8JTZ0_9AGAM|nr:agmatinase [Rhizoctonia solani AG-3 Rhs1AP]